MRHLQITAAAAAAISLMALMIAYFYMQRYLLLEPCPLCILDRFAVGVFALGCVLIVCLPKSRLACWSAWVVSSLGLLAGFIFTGRHIWLQNRPADESALCLSDSATARGLIDLIGQAFDAKADCGAIVWEFFGLSIPEQTLLLFVGLAVLHGVIGYQVWRRLA